MDQQTSWTVVITILQILISAAVGYGAAAIKLGRLLQRVDHLDEDNKDTKKDVKALEKGVTKCETMLAMNQKSTYAQSNSPVSPNEKGRQLLQESNALSFINENKEDLITKIRGLGATTAYDVQESSMKVLLNMAEQKDTKVNGLKEYAFKKGIDLEIVLWVTALALRDIALPILGFTAEDVDKSDPKNEKSDNK